MSWYPEQEAETDWAADLDLMVTAHVTFVRMAEFAWAELEPREGVYDFAWLDRAIALAKARGIRVVLGTPTAAPPAWLTTKYPDVLAIDSTGLRASHGWRRQFSVASPRYRLQAADIAARLAARYGHENAVIGFQIDNEYGRETYDDAVVQRFREWMRARYGSISALNRRQGNAVWSLQYDDWSQIEIPRRPAMPALWLDWLRFTSHIWADYQQNQITAMRPHLAADKLLTTNFVAKYDEFDFSVPAQALDFVSWDWYFEEPVMIPADGAMQHDLYRGFLGRAPWVMETAAGTQSGAVPSYFQLKGETRAMAWQAIGHGADGYAYWLWRSPRNGAETAHGSMVDVDGQRRPIFAEIARTGGEIAAAWPALRGTSPVADVAMIYDYPNRWAIEREPMTKDYSVWQLFVHYRTALGPVSRGVDVLPNVEALNRYRIVVAPNLYLLSEHTTAALLAYVRQGGHLVIGARSGTKDEDSNLTRSGQLSAIAAALGVRIDISAPPATPIALEGELGTGTASVWAERLTPHGDGAGRQTLFRYGRADGWLDGAAAVVSRPVGKGRVTYIGAMLDEPALGRLMAWATQRAGVAPRWPGVPPDVELDERSGTNDSVHVAINWGEHTQTIVLPRPMRDLLTGNVVEQTTLGRFDVAVLSEMP